MSEETENVEQGIVDTYVKWLFEGNVLFIALKFIWTGMWITALTTFQFIETAVILGIGAVLWFIANDYQNWEIQ